MKQGYECQGFELRGHTVMRNTQDSTVLECLSTARMTAVVDTLPSVVFQYQEDAASSQTQIVSVPVTGFTSNSE